METRIWDGIQNKQDKLNCGCSSTSSALAIRKAGNVKRTLNALLIDISGSTAAPTSAKDSTPKITREKEVATMFVSKLPAEAEFAMITFGEPASVEIPMQPLNQKLNAIHKIQRLDYDGATGMRSALKLALKELKNGNANYFKRVYCITDGMGTDGDCSRIADKLKKLDVQLQFIGFGQESAIDEATMKMLASVSENGQPMYMHFTEFSQLSRYMGTQTQTITC